MKNVYFVFLFLIAFSANSQTDSSYKLSPGDFEKGIANTDIQVLDVRTAGEYKTGHIKNSLQADWNQQQQFTERIQYVDKDRPVYVYCLVGGRSSAAAAWMRANGFKKVLELNGGINAWKMASLPLEGDSHVVQMTLEQYWSMIPKDKTVLVDFGADWCPPCIKMKPVIEALEKDKKVTVIRIDGGVQTTIMQELKIEPIPVFIIYKNGEEKWRKQGVVSKEEFEDKLD